MTDHPRRVIHFDRKELGTVAERRRFLGSIAIAIGAIGLVPMIRRGAGVGELLAQSGGETEPGLSDTDILNYALTLEYLEATFYLRADSGGMLPNGAILDALDPDGNGAPGTVPGLSSRMAPAPASFDVATFVRAVRDHEIVHVLALKSALGANALPREEFAFDFGTAFDSAANFLATALVLEDTGVAAYLGQAGNLDNVGILGTAGSILGVEAEHAAAFRLLNGQPVSPGDGDFDPPATSSEVVAAAGGFITTAPALPFP